MTTPLGVMECLRMAKELEAHIANVREAPAIRRLLSDLARVNRRTPAQELLRLRHEIDYIVFSMPSAHIYTGRRLNAGLNESVAQIERLCRKARTAIGALHDVKPGHQRAS